MVEEEMELDLGGDSSTRRASGQILDGICAGCGQDDHTLQTCKGPLTVEGCLRGCPWCNSVDHSWDMCEKKPCTVDSDYHYEVDLRRGRPPLEMKEDWRFKHHERVKIEAGRVEGIVLGRWPWSKGFANKNRLRPHAYLADPQGEAYVGDPDTFNLMFGQGSVYSVENPGPPLPAAFRKPPPRPVVEKSKGIAGDRHRLLKRKSMEMSNDSSADDAYPIPSLKSSRLRRKERSVVLSSNEIEAPQESIEGISKRRMPTVPEDCTEKEANELGRDSFRQTQGLPFDPFGIDSEAEAFVHRRRRNRIEAAAALRRDESETEVILRQRRRLANITLAPDDQSDAVVVYRPHNRSNAAAAAAVPQDESDHEMVFRRRHHHQSNTTNTVAGADNQSDADVPYQPHQPSNKSEHEATQRVSSG